MKKDIIPFYNAGDKYIVKSDDCYLYDLEGKKYIDFESGVWCTNIGHSNKRIIRRAGKQLKKTIHQGYNFRSKSAEKLSAKLQQLAGFENGASVFLSSGSEAVNLSITLAQHLTGRRRILKIDGSYLSAYGTGQTSNDNDSLVNVKFNDVNSVVNVEFGKLAAFVVETGCASYGIVRFPDHEFVNKLVEVCRNNGCLIIAEEVTTGMGRLGTWFGYQHYGFHPDMVVTGKALGNGFPISAVTINSTLAEKFELNPFRYAQSHQNDPFGCSIALEIIKIIEKKDLVSESKEKGEYFRNYLERIQAKHPEKIKDVRGRGLMLALELSESVNGDAISRKLFDNGFVAGFRLNTLRFLPPLTIKRTDIDRLIMKLDELLEEI